MTNTQNIELIEKWQRVIADAADSCAEQVDKEDVKFTLELFEVSEDAAFKMIEFNGSEFDARWFKQQFLEIFKSSFHKEFPGYEFVFITGKKIIQNEQGEHMEIRINEEFQSLIPSLSDEELAGLESSILAEGCREAILIWNGYVVDGHNRYAICTRHNLPFETKEVQGLETELDVKLWMINNQFSRRNLTTETRLALAYKFKEFEAEKARVRQGARNDLTEEDNINPELIESEEDDNFYQLVGRSEAEQKTQYRGALGEIAKRAGVSHTTAEQYDAIQRKGTEEQKKAVSNGEASIKKVYTQIQKAERHENLKTANFPEGKYRVIYADPPWQYGDERSGGSYGGAIDHYPTMSINELCDMPIDTVTDENAVLFLWATAPLLPEALKLIESWGFKYKTNMVWDKVKHNMGYYCSVRHELLLIATKGSCTPDNVQLFDSVQTIERTDKHSEKPEEFRNIIETLYTYGNKLELFARKQTDGWTVYGNEV